MKRYACCAHPVTLRPVALSVLPCVQEGNTALMVASKYGQAAVAELLLLAGADYFMRNKVSACVLFASPTLTPTLTTTVGSMRSP
jgi:ankyrin repeat protein